MCAWQVDARTRGGLRMLRWQNSVLIFDEAHNVEVRGRNQFSACNSDGAGLLYCLSCADTLLCK